MCHKWCHTDTLEPCQRAQGGFPMQTPVPHTPGGQVVLHVDRLGLRPLLHYIRLCGSSLVISPLSPSKWKMQTPCGWFARTMKGDHIMHKKYPAQRSSSDLFLTQEVVVSPSAWGWGNHVQHAHQDASTEHTDRRPVTWLLPGSQATALAPPHTGDNRGKYSSRDTVLSAHSSSPHPPFAAERIKVKAQ